MLLDRLAVIGYSSKRKLINYFLIRNTFLCATIWNLLYEKCFQQCRLQLRIIQFLIKVWSNLLHSVGHIKPCSICACNLSLNRSKFYAGITRWNLATFFVIFSVFCYEKPSPTEHSTNGIIVFLHKIWCLLTLVLTTPQTFLSYISLKFRA